MRSIIPQRYPDDMHPLELFVDLMSTVVGPAELEVWREVASVLDGFGVLDGLTPSDARHVVTALAADAVTHPDDIAGSYRTRADWIEGTPGGREPLIDPVAVAVAVRAAADIVDPDGTAVRL